MRPMLTLSILWLASCAATESSPQVVEMRSVVPFDRIELQGSSDLRVQVGAPLGLSVRGPSGRIHGLVTEVRDGTLFIYRADDADTSRAPTKNSSWWGDEDVEVTVPALVELLVSGSADARLAGFSGGDLSIRVSGSGDLRARGQVERLDISATGSGDLDLSDLAAREAVVRLTGSGDAIVQATDQVDVELSGSGDVLLRGRPAVSRLVSHGSGSIRKP